MSNKDRWDDVSSEPESEQLYTIDELLDLIKEYILKLQNVEMHNHEQSLKIIQMTNDLKYKNVQIPLLQMNVQFLMNHIQSNGMINYQSYQQPISVSCEQNNSTPPPTQQFVIDENHIRKEDFRTSMPFTQIRNKNGNWLWVLSSIKLKKINNSLNKFRFDIKNKKSFERLNKNTINRLGKVNNVVIGIAKILSNKPNKSFYILCPVNNETLYCSKCDQLYLNGICICNNHSIGWYYDIKLENHKCHKCQL